VVTKGARVASRPTENMSSLADAVLRALRNRAITFKSRIMCNFSDISISFDILVLQHVANFFNKMFISHYVI
jgi:hypothetical protein